MTRVKHFSTKNISNSCWSCFRVQTTFWLSTAICIWVQITEYKNNCLWIAVNVLCRFCASPAVKQILPKYQPETETSWLPAPNSCPLSTDSAYSVYRDYSPTCISALITSILVPIFLKHFLVPVLFMDVTICTEWLMLPHAKCWFVGKQTYRQTYKNHWTNRRCVQWFITLEPWFSVALLVASFVYCKMNWMRKDQESKVVSNWIVKQLIESSVFASCNLSILSKVSPAEMACKCSIMQTWL